MKIAGIFKYPASADILEYRIIKNIRFILIISISSYDFISFQYAKKYAFVPKQFCNSP